MDNLTQNYSLTFSGDYVPNNMVYDINGVEMGSYTPMYTTVVYEYTHEIIRCNCIVIKNHFKDCEHLFII